jgi:hypothetical protein
MPCIAAAGLSDSSSCGGLLAANSASEGFLLHPAVLEAALQMQAMRQQQQQQPGNSSDGPTAVSVSAPATIKAYLLPRAAATSAEGAWQELQLSALLGCMQPAGAAAGQHGTSTSSMQLSSRGSVLASLEDAAFRPMQGGGFVAATTTAAAATLNQDGASATAAASISPVLDAAEVAQLVQRTVEAVLGEAVDSQQPLMAAGLDSLGATEVRNSLQASLGLELPATLVGFLDRASSTGSVLQDDNKLACAGWAWLHVLKPV